MANRTTHNNRRILAAPEPKPSSHSLDPTLKKLPKPTLTSSKTSHPTTQNSDPSIPSKKPFFMTNRFPRLNLNNKTRTPQKPPSRDIHLQAKAMTVSADHADSSRFSLIKPNYGLHHSHKADKESFKEKVRNAPKDLDKKKGQQQQQHHHHHHQIPQLLDSKKIVLMTPKEKEVKNLHDHETKKKVSANYSLGRRRSFCGSQVELGDILANCGVKIVSVDMPPFMQIHAVDCARKTHDSLEKFTSKTLALTLKKVIIILTS